MVLFPYNRLSRSFVSPPYIAGTLIDPDARKAMRPSNPDDIALLMLNQAEAIFARESRYLYTRLRGDIPLIKRLRFYEREQLCSTAAVPLYVEGWRVKSAALFSTSDRLLNYSKASNKFVNVN